MCVFICVFEIWKILHIAHAQIFKKIFLLKWCLFSTVSWIFSRTMGLQMKNPTSKTIYLTKVYSYSYHLLYLYNNNLFHLILKTWKLRKEFYLQNLKKHKKTTFIAFHTVQLAEGDLILWSLFNHPSHYPAKMKTAPHDSK